MIIFDFDGVLADSLTTCLAACTKAAHAQGVDLKLTRDAFATLDPLTFEALAERHNLEPVQFAQDVAQTVSGCAQPSPLFGGVAQSLTTLAKDHDLAVVSASHSDVIRTVLATQGLDLLMFRIIGGDTPGQKSEKISGLIALRSDGPHIMVGDASSDIQAARTAGISVIAVAWGWQTPEHLRSFAPDAMAETPAELCRVCLELLNPQGEQS
ncbi:HAD-IA family hydrolase [Aliisedimentitalea scapharcae]|uniref:HAD-IA family hydrolase n=1 Tax=Aliisedimentitalea scapharcae TaxID=1524259 RepID=A0ABZ2XUI1_9RHOB